MDLGEKIYKLRTERNLSQTELADALEVSRQSISKWETGSSVPELDKLVKLSQIFGVSLDELVLDKPAPAEPAAPPPKIVYVERAEKSNIQKVTGIVLLFFAGLLALMLALFGDTLAGLVLAIPFLGCGLVCLLAKRGAGLWCAWVVYLFLNGFLRFAFAINWLFVITPLGIAGITLIIVTAIVLKKQHPGTLRADIWGTVVSWAVYLTSWLLLTVRDSEPVIYAYSQERAFVTAVSGCIRSIFLMVALVFTIRLIQSLFKKWSAK